MKKNKLKELTLVTFKGTTCISFLSVAERCNTIVTQSDETCLLHFPVYLDWEVVTLATTCTLTVSHIENFME